MQKIFFFHYEPVQLKFQYQHGAFDIKILKGKLCGKKHLHHTVEHRGASEEYRMIVFNNRSENMLLDLQQE